MSDSTGVELTKEKAGERECSPARAPKKARSDEEKWVFGGLAVMLPLVGLRYRDEVEAWVYDNRVWLVGIAVLLIGSCVVAMWSRQRAAPGRGRLTRQQQAALGSEGLPRTPTLAKLVDYPQPTSIGQAASDRTVGRDAAPALFSALKLDYSGGRPRTVSRGPTELGEEWVIELPPGGVYGDLASKEHRIASWLDVPHDQFTSRPVPGTRHVVLLTLDAPLYSRVPALPDPVEAAARGMLPVGYSMDSTIIEIPSPVGDTQMLVAGSTGGGKTEELKWLAYYGLLNGWDLVIVDGKGDGDLAYLEKVCLAYEEVPDHARMMAVLSFVEEEHLRRAAANSASVRSGAGKAVHRPLLVIVDEVSTYTDEAESKKQAAEFETKLKVVSRKVRSSRILVVLSTQNPKAEVINTSIRGNHRVRIALGCADRDQSDVILGGGTAKSGFDASKLPDVPGAAILQVKDKNRELRGFMVSDEEIKTAVDARVDAAREDEPETFVLVREAYGDDEFLSTTEFASRMRRLGVEIPDGDDEAATGKAVAAWLSETFGRSVPTVQQGRVRGRRLQDIVTP